MVMHELCPVCGLKYQREPGYFVMSLYFSYALSIPPCLLIMLALWRWTKLEFNTIMLLTFLAYLPFVALSARWARTFWMHMDWYFDPEESKPEPGPSHT